ncbi:DUF2625 domain-containing protein [Catenulispora pinisilvae]|uniref:DUF2625 domain-containing protein n=1 Tax=Catenulispora pinisilvae TaxID=2705253 RepID=UPI0018924622|nr:DUF2625 domain-containing protein [Catenulispora pinisilvae]
MRELTELIEVEDPAWPDLQALFAACPIPLTVFAPDARESTRGLLQLQVTARSMLGGLTLHSGGLLVDDGWVRVFGGGSGEDGSLPSLARVNGFPATFDPAWQAQAGLVVAHDVLGGVFAVNGVDPAAVGRPGQPGQMTYFAPDTLEWEALDIGHSAWLGWLLSERLEGFYSALRWEGWRAEVAAAGPAQGISVFPFLWSKQAEDVATTSRRTVPMAGVLGISADFANQIGVGDPGFLGLV